MPAAALFISFVLLAISQSGGLRASGRGGLSYSTGHSVVETFSFIEDRCGFRWRECPVALVPRDVLSGTLGAKGERAPQGPPSLFTNSGLELSRAEFDFCEVLDVPRTGLGRADSISTVASLRGSFQKSGRPVMVARLRGGAAFRCAGGFWSAGVPAAGRRLASRGSVTYRLPAVRAYFDVLLEAVLFRIFQPSFHRSMIPLPVFVGDGPALATGMDRVVFAYQ